jgi:hypothetical protein
MKNGVPKTGVRSDLPIAAGRSTEFRRLMIAQDTGSAMVGPARANSYWGAGDEAGRVAGRTSVAATSKKAAARKCHRTAPSASVTARMDVFPNLGDGKPAAGRHRTTLTLRSPPSSEGTTYFSGCNRQGGRRTMTTGGGPEEVTSLSYGSAPPGT